MCDLVKWLQRRLRIHSWQTSQFRASGLVYGGLRMTIGSRTVRASNRTSHGGFVGTTLGFRTSFTAVLATACMLLAGTGGQAVAVKPGKKPYVPPAPIEKLVPHETPAFAVTPFQETKSSPIPDREELPAAQQSAVPLDPQAGDWQPLGSLPLSLHAKRQDKRAQSSSHGQTGTPSTSAAPGLRVSARWLSPESKASRAVSGPVFELVGLSTQTSDQLQLNYSSFAHAGSAGWANRLRFVSYPSCFATTPEDPKCAEPTELPTVNDFRRQTLTVDTAAIESADTARSGALKTISTTTLLAASPAAAGSTGDFSASSLAATGSWSQGGATGGFNWEYPLTMPTPGTGQSVAPNATLSYNSQAVDGQTNVSNNQTSWVGQGWDFSPGYVERTYRTCNDESTTMNTQDLCWTGWVVTLQMPGGPTTELVKEGDTWRPAVDNGDRVELLSNADNGGYEGEYWVITTRNGTKYTFGRNRLPGSSTADATNSAWTIPVYHPNTSDPCGAQADKKCTMIWRWNVDMVEDVNGNATIYNYAKESNYYQSSDGRVGYDRGGYLTDIRYGLNRNDGLYAAQAPQKIDFTVAERCFPGSKGDCSNGQFDAAHSDMWPDTPIDQSCTATSACDDHAPTFWSRKRLTSVATRVYSAGSYQKVDQYDLNQAFLNWDPVNGNTGEPQLVLQSVTRTAFAGGTSVANPPVEFNYVQLANRVEGLHNLPPMLKYRLFDVKTETGQHILVTYSGTGGQQSFAKPLCTATTIPASPSTNTTECFPVKWAPFGTDLLDYFHKYVVTQVVVQDANVGATQAPSRVTTYTYVGDPAWHYDDNEVAKPKNRTYGQFRGYGKVDVSTGSDNSSSNGLPDKWTLTRNFYYRGMDGDILPGGGNRSVSLTDSESGSHPDNPAFNGQLYESQVYNGVGGALISKVIHTPKVVKTTAVRTRTGIPDLKAQIVRQTGSTSYTAKASGGFLTSTTTTVYDPIEGRPLEVTTSASGAKANCVKTEYADNTSNWVKDVATTIYTYETTCPTTATPNPVLLSATRTYYDGSTTLGSVTKGMITRSQTATTNNAGTFSWATVDSTYDAYGRPRTSTIQNPGAVPSARVTKTDYTPAGTGAITKVVTTLPIASQQSTQFIDPLRGVVTKSVGVDATVTEGTYDAMGRLTAVWRPGQVKGTDPATEKHTYYLSPTAPMAVKTETLVDTGAGTPAYKTRIVLFDGFGQLRQAQADAVGGGRVVSDNFSDSHGWSVTTYDHWYTTGAPQPIVITTNQSNIDDWQQLYYDGAGRTTKVVGRSGAVTNPATAQVQTIYSGDSVTNLAPTGGVSFTNVLDGKGQVIEYRQYTKTPTVNGNTVTPAAGGTDTMTYTYDGIGQQTTQKSAVGTTQVTTWSNNYDLAGRVIKAVSPDSGTTLTTYYDTGEVATRTDGANRTLAYDYDALGRPLHRYQGSLGGAELASWTYDTLLPGHLTSSKSTENTVAYTNTVTGYDAAARPLGSTVGLSLTGFQSTYTTSQTWTSTGLMKSTTMASSYSALGGLNAETLTYSYDTLGNAAALEGNNTYVSAATYTPYGEPSQYVLGVNDQTAALTFQRDTKTRKITDMMLSGQLATPQIERMRYTYDQAGNIVKTVNNQGGSTAPIQTQCFAYDLIRQLKDAWSSTDSCATNPSTLGNNSKVGGPQPYWLTWTYDAAGNRTKQVKRGIGTAASTTTTYANATSAHPHAMTSAATTGATTSTSTFTYNLDGSMAKRTIGTAATTFTYDPDGTIDTVAAPTGASVYAQDADGAQLVRDDTLVTTLYLPGQEIQRTKATGAISVNRYYSFNGTNVAMRQYKSGVRYLMPDANGSTQVAVNPVGWVIARSYRDPYGNKIGSSGTFPGTRGFQNQPENTLTGLTDMGARLYDPITGRFTSVDPVITPRDPQQTNGYTYASNNPMTFADPSGLLSIMPDSGGTYTHSSYTPGSTYTAPTPQTFPDGFVHGVGKGAKDLIKDLDPRDIIEGISNLIKDPPGWAESWDIAKAVGMEIFHVDLVKDMWDAYNRGDYYELGVQVGKLAVKLGADLLMTVVGAKAGALLGDAMRAAPAATTATREASIATQAVSCALHSFSGDTPVTMADGRTKPIRNVKIGDRVKATNPKTGKTYNRRVTYTWIHSDHLTKARIGNQTITTTRDHKFYNATTHRWQHIGSFRTGDHTRGLNGQPGPTYRGFQHHTTRVDVAYNLTIAHTHTYYIGHHPLLVHNCGGATKTVPGYGVGATPKRVPGPWTISDLKQGAFGRPPRSLGRPDLHHADQMPGSGIHEVPPGMHRGNTSLHPNRYNQGVTDGMRMQDRQLHWWYRSQEMGGWDTLGPSYYYDNWP